MITHKPIFRSLYIVSNHPRVPLALGVLHNEIK